ncbi:MAG: class I SAM-dependent methyltransferase [Acidobacteria bacterium]|nr:class I SAM-dependent methyltransferase [Acidobacteriota bacterium]
MSRESARALARLHLERGEPLGWFEPLYRQHRDTPWEIPWADAKSNLNLTEWLESERPATGEALVVGCGLGDDACELEARGFAVTAFDVSPTAIEMCRARFPESGVSWVVADLFHLPGEWRRRFPLVISLNTLQVLPEESLRRAALECILEPVEAGGSALVIVRGREEADAQGLLPWPLLRRELDPPEDMEFTRFDDYLDKEDPPVRRFRVQYRRLR